MVRAHQTETPRARPRVARPLIADAVRRVLFDPIHRKELRHEKSDLRLFVLGLVTLSGLASQFARSDDEKTPTIKEVMQKLHKGPSAALAKLKKDLASDSLDWKDIQAKANDFETYGAALPKNDPPKGEKQIGKNSRLVLRQCQELNESAKEEDKDGVKAAFAKISNAWLRLPQGPQARFDPRSRARALAGQGGGLGIKQRAALFALSNPVPKQGNSSPDHWQVR